MMILEFVGLLFAGLLAGEEVTVRYGVHPALRALDDAEGIRARQRLIYRLRVFVPALFVPTLGLAIALTVVGVAGGGSSVAVTVWHCVGLVGLVGWAVTTFGGTVLINQTVIEWDADAPPAGWAARVLRWERLDVIRSSAAVLAFGALLVAAALAA